MLFFDEAFKSLSSIKGYSSGNDLSDKVMYSLKTGAMHPDVVKKMAAFNASKEAKDSTYLEGMRMAYVSAVRASPSFAERMTEKEMEVAGLMMALATNPEWLSSMVAKAKECRAEMAE